jgi:hypothetical protein
MIDLSHKDGEGPRKEGKKMTHKFQVKNTELGYVTCCGTSIIKITKAQDPEMHGSVNWYYQDKDQFADDCAFYSFADVKKYLMQAHDRKFGTMQYTEKVLAESAAALAKAGA